MPPSATPLPPSQLEFVFLALPVRRLGRGARCKPRAGTEPPDEVRKNLDPAVHHSINNGLMHCSKQHACSITSSGESQECGGFANSLCSAFLLRVVAARSPR